MTDWRAKLAAARAERRAYAPVWLANLASVAKRRTSKGGEA